jgi:hypothetical protein
MNKYDVEFSAILPYDGSTSQRVARIIESDSKVKAEQAIRTAAWVWSIDVRNFEITEIEDPPSNPEIEVSNLMIKMDTILSKNERVALRYMSKQWHEVERSELLHERIEVCDELGNKILWIIEAYLDILDEESEVESEPKGL